MGENNSKNSTAKKRSIDGFAGDVKPRSQKSATTGKSTGALAKSSTSSKSTKAVTKSRARVPAKISRKKSPYGKIDASKIKIEEAEVSAADPKEPTKSEISEKSPKSEKPKHHHRSRVRVQYIIVGILLALIAGFIARVAIWEHNYLAAKEGSERAVVIEEAYDGGEEVDETEPTEEEIVEYHVPADRARYITIRSAGVYRARVQDIGQLASGAIDTPYNIYNVGWYVNSALPGQAGVTVMDGHGGSLGNGIFKNLPNVSPYDEIVIEMGDEVTSYRYIVVDVAYRNLEDADAYMPTAFSSPEPGTPSLTLITCTGNWIQTSQTYSQRMFVRAILAS